ncbi:MAG: DNA repair protein RadC [Crocinitomicaceae bacterium]|nr:DNA repair protein RadC [Crocinitomicaceae bacterium]
MNSCYLTIKSWAEDDRPREKMILKGKSVLSDAELIAIILGSGTRTKSAVDLAQEILMSVDNDLYRLGQLNLTELKKFSGVGDAKAVSLAAALELGRRRRAVGVRKIEKVTGSKDVYEFVRRDFEDLIHEEFRVLGLKRSNEIIRSELVSRGGMTGTIADGKLIFKALLDMKAVACILVHNHPSGNLKPSGADVSLTKKLSEFGRMIDLQVLDHLIVTDHGYYSFADNSLI